MKIGFRSRVERILLWFLQYSHIPAFERAVKDEASRLETLLREEFSEAVSALKTEAEVDRTTFEELVAKLKSDFSADVAIVKRDLRAVDHSKHGASAFDERSRAAIDAALSAKGIQN